MHPRLILFATLLAATVPPAAAQSPSLPERPPTFVVRLEGGAQAPRTAIGEARVMTEPELVTWAALDFVAQRMNRLIELPDLIDMKAHRCGGVNAYYDRQNRTIVVCFELAEAILDDFGRTDPTRSLRLLAGRTLSVVHMVLLHEVGHALVERLNLPVLGREEDAADQFAVWVAMEEGDDENVYRETIVATYATALLSLTAGDIEHGSSFASTHPLGVQRATNVICWAAGHARANGRAAALFEGALPLTRLRECEREYAELSQAWRSLLSSALLGEPRYTWGFAENMDGTFHPAEDCRESLAQSIYAPTNSGRMTRVGLTNMFLFRGSVERYRVHAFLSLSECRRALETRRGQSLP
jgi:hypothetical protein